MKKEKTYPWTTEEQRYSFYLPDGTVNEITLVEAQDLREQLARLIADNVELRMTTPILVPYGD